MTGPAGHLGATTASIGGPLQKQDPNGLWHACGGHKMRRQSGRRSSEAGDGPHAGGRNIKITALTDGRGLPVKLLIVEGQAYEDNDVIPLLEAPEGLMLVGDSRAQRDSQPQAARRARRSRGNGFDSDPLRRQLEQIVASH